MWGVLGTRGAAVVALLLAVTVAPAAGTVPTLTRVPVAAASEEHRDEPGPSLEGDVLPPAQPPPGARTVRVGSAKLPPTPGWTPYTARYRFQARPTYEVRLVRRGGNDADVMRAGWESAVLRNPYVDMTVMPGTVRRTKPRRGEILVVLDSTSRCGRAYPNWLGCSQPQKLTWVPGTDRRRALVHSGTIRIRPRLLETYPTHAVHVYMHEIGHILGMSHFDKKYEGAYQVMRTQSSTSTTYQAGDRHGLASARKLEKGFRNFRDRAVTAVRYQGKPWLFGVDATGQPWVRRPKKGGGFRWQYIGGTIQGNLAAVPGTDRIDVFGIGTNGDLYQKTWAGGRWTGWSNRLALSWAGGVTAMAPTPGRFHVWGRASGGQLGHAYVDGDNRWVHNSALGGTLIGDVAALHLPEQSAWSIWGIGSNHLLYQRNYTNGAWGAWAAVAGSPDDFRGPLRMARTANGRYHLFGLTMSGDVRHPVWTPGIGWKFPKIRTTPVRGRIGLLENRDNGRFQIFAPDLSGHIRMSQQQRKGWSRFELVGPR
ncbi:MAG TPA: hypothetical protein VD859_08325 [Nocardioides sp.]|nr:hypothetical protein [Nocardioides sp.]